MRREPGELESEVLAALWAAAEPLTPGDVLEQLGDDLAYTTVMTTLGRLYDKDLVKRHRVGRGYAYAPRVRESDLAARRIRTLLDRGHDRNAILQGFVSELSADEECALRALLGDPRPGGGES